MLIVVLAVLCETSTDNPNNDQQVNDAADTSKRFVWTKIFLMEFLLTFMYSNNLDDFTVAETQSLSKDKHEFQAEINRLMSILVNSIYSNRDVFLRELISNSADALDKIRYLGLLNPAELGEGERAKLEIKIKADKENKLLHIRDTGIGMTKDDLINNLGKIAKSGTSEFIEKVKAGADVNQIGQFGVGFYSAFLVADTVTVTTKHNNDSQYIWQSSIDDQTSYTISEDPRGNTLGRGTLITLHIRDDSTEFLEESKLRELIKKYSEFITFPIYLWTEKVVQEPVEEEKKVAEETEEPKEVIEEVDEEEEKEETPKTVERRYHEWELINQNKPIWKRNKNEITDEEYKEFYKSLTNDGSEPLQRIHFNAEGDVSFTCLLYIPGEKPFEIFQPTMPTLNLKLYVKRVFITDKFDDMIPKYLSFLVGVIDSDDLPLSISRETFKHHKAYDTIKKQIVRKAIAMFQEAAENEDEYKKIYDRYSVNLKVGAIEDRSQRDRLMKLLRFKTYKHRDKPISLSKYVEEMKEGQDVIYFLGGETIESLVKSPLMEKLIKKDYDVVLLTEPIDEYVVNSVYEFNNGTNKFRFVDISKEGLNLDKEEEEELKKRTDEYSPLINHLKEILSKHVEKVVLTTRLSDTPCTLTSAVYGYSANMERIIKAQALHDRNIKDIQMNSKKILEINPDHPIIKKLLSLIQNDEKETVTEMGKLLYDTARLTSGFQIDNPIEFSSRIYDSIRKGLDITEEVTEEKIEHQKEENIVESDNKDEL